VGGSEVHAESLPKSGPIRRERRVVFAAARLAPETPLAMARVGKADAPYIALLCQGQAESSPQLWIGAYHDE